MNCQKCNSERVANVCGKCSDLFNARMVGSSKEHVGYALGSIGIEGGDYMAFDVCLDCGQIQGEFPRPTIPELEEKWPECPACGNPMLLVSEAEAFAGRPKQQIYRCEKCGKDWEKEL